MEGTPPPGSTPPPPPPVTPTPPKKGGSGRVTTTEGVSFIPRPSGSTDATAKVPLASRTSNPTTVTPLVNQQQKAVDNYVTQAKETLALEAQASFLSQIANLKEQVINPEQIPENTPFFFYYQKDGKKLRVIPPEDSLKANPAELKSICARLESQLDNVDRHYHGPQVKAFVTKLQDSKSRLQACQKELDDLGISPPVVSPLVVFTFSELTSATRNGLPAKPLPDGEPKPDDGEFILVPNSKKSARKPPKPVPPPLGRTDALPPLPEGWRESDENGEDEITSAPPPLSKLEFLIPEGSGLARVNQVHLGAAPGSRHSSIFAPAGIHQQNGKMASVNAGNPDLGITGHSGINQRFEQELQRAGHNPASFQVLHQDLLRDVKTTPDDFFAKVSSNKSTPLLCAAIYNSSGRDEDSIIFDVFRQNHRPQDNPDNAAMVYMVPPNGQQNFVNDELGRANFLMEVKNKARDLALAQNRFNLWARTQKNVSIPELSVLRTCQFSGERFKHPKANEADVASAIKAGFDEALKTMNNCTIREIQFEDGSTGHFAKVATKT